MQKYVETLDMLKIKNSTMPNGNGNHAPSQHQQKRSNGHRFAPIQEEQPKYSNGQRSTPILEQQARHSVGNSPAYQQEQQQSRNSASGAVVVTTQWETFDSTPALMQVPSTSTSNPVTNNSVHQPKFPWDFYG